jgi:hypothetical protein
VAGGVQRSEIGGQTKGESLMQKKLQSRK